VDARHKAGHDESSVGEYWYEPNPLSSPR